LQIELEAWFYDWRERRASRIYKKSDKKGNHAGGQQIHGEEMLQIKLQVSMENPCV
jgi:hypothetical protein